MALEGAKAGKAGGPTAGAGLRARLRRLLGEGEPDRVVVNVGSGPGGLSGPGRVINADLFPFPGVDLVADAARLPLRGGSVDLVVSIALLEHVPDAAAVVAEFHRVLRPGGRAFCHLPFLAPFHAAPADYQRWSPEGARRLFAGFAAAEVGLAYGPVSALLWLGQEGLAFFLSLGWRPARDLLFLFLAVLTSPLKLLDLLFARLPGAERLAAAFFVEARKEAGPAAGRPDRVVGHGPGG